MAVDSVVGSTLKVALDSVSFKGIVLSFLVVFSALLFSKYLTSSLSFNSVISLISSLV